MSNNSVLRASRALIHLDYLQENISLVRKKTGKKICMPVKADAYGHGALSIAKTALDSGAEYLAIATVNEGKELRDGGITAPIIIFSIVLPEEVDALIASDLEPMAGDSEYIEILEERAAKAGKKVPVHLKIDTGMGRLGCTPGDAVSLASRIAGSKNLVLAGTATHFAVSDSLEQVDIDYTNCQIECFNQAVESIKKAGIDPGLVHAANTGAVTFYNHSWFDMVRPGILLYGYEPENSAKSQFKPIMELESALTFIKKIKKGQSISYGRTWTAGEDTIIGTIPIGYGDGLSRQLSNNWQVTLADKYRKEGKQRPLVGRICMDQCMVDLGIDSTERRWDPVTIFGGKAPHAGEMALALNTIPYEITCNINKRVPRVYIGYDR